MGFSFDLKEESANELHSLVGLLHWSLQSRKLPYLGKVR